MAVAASAVAVVMVFVVHGVVLVIAAVMVE